MGKKWMTPVMMAVLAAALVAGALMYLRPGRIRVEVRFTPPERLNMPEQGLRAWGLERGGFEVTLRERGIQAGTTLSPARLAKFAQFTSDEAAWLYATFETWPQLGDDARREVLARISLIIQRSLRRHGGAMEQYMDERMGTLRDEDERRSGTTGALGRLASGGPNRKADTPENGSPKPE